MGGILDGKARVLDTIITQVGKRQLAQGGIDVKYVSFSDSTTFYKKDLESPDFLPFAENPIGRIQFEACNLPQDQVVFSINTEGKIDYSTLAELNGPIIRDGNVIIEYSGSAENESDLFIDGLISSSLDNFEDLQILGTSDFLFDDADFQITQQGSGFRITETSVKHEDSLIDVFRDRNFSNSIKYKFLPPISRVNDDNIDKSDYDSFKEFQIAQYEPWGLIGGEKNKLSIEDVFSSTSLIKNINRENKKFLEVTETSRENNLLFQLFESTTQGTNKSVENIFFVDLGVHKVPEGQIKRKLNLGNEVHLIFAGKLVKKKNTGTFSFVRLFTIICG
jgi:hypothetical protein